MRTQRCATRGFGSDTRITHRSKDYQGLVRQQDALSSYAGRFSDPNEKQLRTFQTQDEHIKALDKIYDEYDKDAGLKLKDRVIKALQESGIKLKGKNNKKVSPEFAAEVVMNPVAGMSYMGHKRYASTIQRVRVPRGSSILSRNR